jgi:hypothetical protein
MDFQYILATDIDRAWLNFELDLPLEPGPKGEPNPFYVERPGNPTARLERELLREYSQTPKYFFSGHRGCGKSTELRRLAVNPKILAKYWPIHFTIRDEADINNLDFKDVLFAIGARLYRDYSKAGKKLPEQLIKELNTWRGQVETEVKTNLTGRVSEVEIEAGLEAFFANAGLKMKLEPATRNELRQVFERNLSELVDVINKVATAIYAHEKRPPLVLIDDLDKPDLKRSSEIFSDHRETMLQPNVPIVYTVSSPLFYSSEFQAIRDRAVFLPNVKLHEQGQPEARDPNGYQAMQMFVHRRMLADLIANDALEAATHTSGGLFREMARIMRSAIDHAAAIGRKRIEIEDVQKAEAEIRGEYRRFLTREQREVLNEIRRNNRYEAPEKIAPLLQMLAALEYANGEPWCDVHPALLKLLGEEE